MLCKRLISIVCGPTRGQLPKKNPFFPSPGRGPPSKSLKIRSFETKYEHDLTHLFITLDVESLMLDHDAFLGGGIRVIKNWIYTVYSSSLGVQIICIRIFLKPKAHVPHFYKVIYDVMAKIYGVHNALGGDTRGGGAEKIQVF